MDAVAVHLARHDFKTLFVEVLGWDHAAAEHRFEADGLTFDFHLIAHKRGFQILVCETDRYTLFNRSRLRELERQVFRLAHEHIVIYTCKEPRKQVWQWAIHMPDKGRLRHREHPFFSKEPPQALVERLGGLRFGLAEEEQVTLVDALDRVRLALDTVSELSFVKKPWYAEQSDRLARAMRAGGEPEFHIFVMFHIRLSRWGGRLITRRIGIAPEDAEQIACLTLMRAARGFDPALGYQFSTYACTALQRGATRCYREPFLITREAVHAYRWFRHVQRSLSIRFAEAGTSEASRFLRERILVNPGTALRYAWLEAVTNAEPLPPLSKCERNWDGSPLLDEEDGGSDLHRDAMALIIRSAIAKLSPADQRIVQLRYGFGAEEHTLERIAQEFGLTKERIRQRLLKAEAIMRPHVLQMLGEPPEPPREPLPGTSAPERQPSIPEQEPLASLAQPLGAAERQDSDPPVLSSASPHIQPGLFSNAH